MKFGVTLVLKRFKSLLNDLINLIHEDFAELLLPQGWAQDNKVNNTYNLSLLLRHSLFGRVSLSGKLE